MAPLRLGLGTEGSGGSPCQAGCSESGAIRSRWVELRGWHHFQPATRKRQWRQQITFTACHLITLTLMPLARDAAGGAEPESGEQGSLWGSRGWPWDPGERVPAAWPGGQSLAPPMGVGGEPVPSTPAPPGRGAGCGRGCDPSSKSIITARMTGKTEVLLKHGL